MKSISIAVATLSILLFSACMNNSVKKTATDQKSPETEVQTNTTEQQPLVEKLAQRNELNLKNDSIRTFLLTQGRIIASRTQRAIKAELQAAMRAGGLEQAVSTCSVKAMPLTDSISSVYDVSIRRLAKKNRNPANATNKEEDEIYKAYLLAWIEQRPLYESLVADQDGHPVYYRPIKVDGLCLNCHGSVGEQIPQNLAGKIAALYPEDKAIDFKEGQLRGMWAITFNEYQVKPN